MMLSTLENLCFLWLIVPRSPIGKVGRIQGTGDRGSGELGSIDGRKKVERHPSECLSSDLKLIASLERSQRKGERYAVALR